MDSPSSTDHCYRFGPFRFDVSRQQLFKDDRPVELARRLARTLQLLIENHGKDLPKSYLMEQLWPDTVVEENNLTVIISMLRKVLEDDAEYKKYILTNPGRGYRFVAEVTEIVPGAPAPTPPAVPTAAPVAENVATLRSRIRRHAGLASLAAALFFLLATFGVREWLRRNAAQSIAVLPFQSLGAEADDGYLGLGMAEGLITRLRTIRHVAVRATAEVAKYQNTAHDPRTLGKELHVVSLLDGSVQRTGDQISLHVRLLRVKDGAILWSGEYHGSFADILPLQDRIAEQATRALALKLDSKEQQSIHRHSTRSSDAYQFYLAARYYCGPSGDDKHLERGIGYFRQAIEKDPQFALAYAGLATCYVQLANFAEQPLSNESLAKAKVAAQSALEIDRNLPEAYLPLALVRMYYDWDFPGAESAFRSSIDLAPEDSAGHVWYAEFLSSQGRSQEADREAHSGAELDPFSWSADLTVNNVYFFGHHYKEAADRWEKSLDINLDEAPWYLGWIYASQGRPIPMIEALVKMEATAPRKPVYTATLAYLYALNGMKPLAEGLLQKLTQHPDKTDDYQISLIYIALGDKEKAFESLTRAKEQRSWRVIYLNVDPRFEGLRSDPRFGDLLHEIHLSH
jgi:TolB-like protein/DNA-binding winged helix-turn-helix (wHTH) protein